MNVHSLEEKKKNWWGVISARTNI